MATLHLGNERPADFPCPEIQHFHPTSRWGVEAVPSVLRARAVPERDALQELLLQNVHQVALD